MIRNWISLDFGSRVRQKEAACCTVQLVWVRADRTTDLKVSFINHNPKGQRAAKNYDEHQFWNPLEERKVTKTRNLKQSSADNRNRGCRRSTQQQQQQFTFNFRRREEKKHHGWLVGRACCFVIWGIFLRTQACSETNKIAKKLQWFPSIFCPPVIHWIPTHDMHNHSVHVPSSALSLPRLLLLSEDTSAEVVEPSNRL